LGGDGRESFWGEKYRGKWINLSLFFERVFFRE